MNTHQIFNDSFEVHWKEFDEIFRKNLLKNIGDLGSLHRIAGTDEEINVEYSGRFYKALEESLASGQFISKWKKALTISIPKNFDELIEIFELHAVYPLHAFYLLLIYVHEYPMRAFFSGRDKPLPVNTLTLKFEQSLGESLPTSVGYELDRIQLDYCPHFAYDRNSGFNNMDSSDLQNKPKRHPQHHWHDLIWVWHFDWDPPVIFE